MKKTIWIVACIVIVLILMILGLFLSGQDEMAPDIENAAIDIENTTINIENATIENATIDNQELPVKDFISPEEINQYSDKILINRVGQENFMEYFQFQKAELIEPSNKDKRYVISYLINDYSSVVWLHTNGSIWVLDGYEHIIGIPNCIQDEIKCTFIEKDKVLELAQKNNTSFKETSATFGWSKDYGLENEVYVWEVSTKPTNSGNCILYQSLIINANDGNILKHYPEKGICP